MVFMEDKPWRRLVGKLPTALLVVACLWVIMEIILAAAKGTGVSTLVYYLLASPFILILCAIPFAWQMHKAGNARGLLLGIGLCLLTGIANLATVLTYWPLKLSLAWSQSDLIKVSESLQPGEKRTVDSRIGLISFREAWKLPNGHTCFTNGTWGDATGLIYDPAGDPTGINEWSNIRISDQWSVVEQD